MGTVLEVKDIHKSLGGGERLLKGGAPNQGTGTIN